MAKQILSTPNAPAAIGTYSQGVKVGDTVYLSGQIPLDPVSMPLVPSEIAPQIAQVFSNLAAVAAAAGTTLDTAVKLTVYLTDLGHFPLVNEAMARVFTQPYPARATVQVSALPKGALVEVDAVLVLPE